MNIIPLSIIAYFKEIISTYRIKTLFYYEKQENNRWLNFIEGNFIHSKITHYDIFIENNKLRKNKESSQM